MVSPELPLLSYLSYLPFRKLMTMTNDPPENDSDADADLEWEEWDGSGSFLGHCIAGSIAGIAEHTLVYPIDTVRTHMQVREC